jgi:polyphosphate kinase
MTPDADAAAASAPFLNAELSLLDFAARVVALAEEERTPLLERLRFLSIAGANVDEFYMVRVAGLRRAVAAGVATRSADGLDPREQLEAISMRVAPLEARLRAAWRACVGELARYGVRLRSWGELTPPEREGLRDRFREEILPALTPLAMTLSPGHPFPLVRHLRLSLAVVLHEGPGRPPRFVEVELPEEAPRLLPVPGRVDRILLEDVVRANLDLLHPDARVEHAHLFRVTRAGDLELDERRAPRLLDAVQAAARRRGANPVVRIEVERGMPVVLRELIVAELRREQEGGAGGGRGRRAEVRPEGAVPDDAELHETEPPLDIAGLAGLAALPFPQLRYPPFRPRDPLAGAPSIWRALRERDVLAYHPYEDWERTALRFLADAAEDPDVATIRLTLYRAGERSPVVEALARAAGAGKEVVAFVELKARFDEARNVAWATELERTGVRVVHGIVGLKNHSKLAVVVRREGGKARRYALVATGNFNPDSARRYTDLTLLTAREDVAADVSDLFNELTGAPRAPARALRRCLAAPTHLLPELLRRIEREAEHARAGRGGRIRLKVNGLSEPAIVHALCDASRAGVEVELVVRGICALRPGVPGVSERIRVVSIVGRFLEHARIYHFANGGDPEWFIGSADLRTRNLRRRVELLAPVLDETCRERLDRILGRELSDPAAWTLTPHGEYVPGSGAGPSAQERWLEELSET